MQVTMDSSNGVKKKKELASEKTGYFSTEQCLGTPLSAHSSLLISLLSSSPKLMVATDQLDLEIRSVSACSGPNSLEERLK